MKKLLFLLIIFTALFISCRKDNIAPNNISSATARDSIYNIMNEWYYWNDLMPTVTKEDYDDPYQLLDAMLYKDLDRWSFIADYNEFVAQMQGIFVGHGFRIGIDNSGNARISLIYNESPLYKVEGVRRGWIVKKINGVELAPIIIAGDVDAYHALLGPFEAGITNSFVFQDPDGNEVNCTSTKSTFTINSVLLYDTLHLPNEVVGHLVFESFIAPSPYELYDAFDFFNANNIEDLILDLRYNSGGYLSVARILASYIAGNTDQNDVFAKLAYNSNHEDANDTYNFILSPFPLGLSRVIVITTRETASASEAVINGLKPFIDVISIGDTTNGKPTGMNGWDIGEKYFFWPVTFKIVNAEDQGDFFDGINPGKLVSDDITHDFSDREELCLKEAIYYLNNRAFSGKGGSYFQRYPQISEKPLWMNNTFVLKK